MRHEGTKNTKEDTKKTIRLPQALLQTTEDALLGSNE